MVHDLPATVEQAQAIHRDAYSREQYLAALPRLQVLRRKLNSAGALDLTTIKGQTAADALRNLTTSSGTSDLIILIGHRELEDASLDPVEGRYHVRFHDGSTYALSETRRTRPVVWVISCDTWQDLAAQSEAAVLALATVRPLTYAQGALAAELILGSKNDQRRCL